VETPLANFFASGVLELREKLGPILWQLPPNFRYDRARLEAFFELLPRDSEKAAALARRHDHRLDGRASVSTDRRRPLRHALEVRHPSFENPEFIDVLRKHDVALVVADTAGKWPFLEDVTSDFVYVRLHGDEELYVSGYTESALEEWARKIRAWSRGGTPSGVRLAGTPIGNRERGRDIFVYFDNDVKVRAPFDAMTLAHSLGLGPKPGPPPDVKTIRETPRTRWPLVTSKGRRIAAMTSKSAASGDTGKTPIFMPKGDKSTYTGKQKRQADKIEKSYERRGVSKKTAKARAWATVNKTTGGGKKSGSGRGKKTNQSPARKGGRKGGRATAKKKK
jgi:uncharacterized protein YecE (DUF72 family)